MLEGVMHRYWKWMPPELHIIPKDRIVTLGEGNTRLWRAKKLEDYLSDLSKYFRARVWLKIEGDNLGTGSFKDRGMTVAITKAAYDGKKFAICASTGNTAAAAAAYSQAAGMKCFVVLPEGNVAAGKLLQSYRHGAEVIQIRGNFDKALQIVKDVVVKNPAIEMVNSINPYRMHGQKTAAFEIVDQLGRAPRYHFIPIGNGGNITAYWLGYKEYYAEKKVIILPHMMGYQASGAAPIVRNKIIENPKTIATAIRIGNPAKWNEAKEAVKESGGVVDSVTDREILCAFELISRCEPVSCEPSSATSVAGLIKIIRETANTSNRQTHQMYMWYDCDIVCVLTGAGFKDPDTAKKVFCKKPQVIEPTFGAVMEVIKNS